jgi:hypothetical protein
VQAQLPTVTCVQPALSLLSALSGAQAQNADLHKQHMAGTRSSDLTLAVMVAGQAA